MIKKFLKKFQKKFYLKIYNYKNLRIKKLKFINN